MGRALSLSKREEIVRRHEQGATLASVADTMKLSFYTVRKIWRRYCRRGPEGLGPDYDRCCHSGPRADRRLYQAALQLKREHPRWGAPLIVVLLKRKWPARVLSSPRTLQRWFRAAGLQPRRRPKPPPNAARAKQPHEVWQADATEGHALGTGQKTSWLTVTDEYTGAILAAPLFPPRAMEPGLPP